MLVTAAKALLERVYRCRFIYHKAGVFLTDIVPDLEGQQSLTDSIDGECRAHLIEAADRINRKVGSHTIHARRGDARSPSILEG